MSPFGFARKRLYLGLVCLIGCLDPYEPPVVQGEVNLLVVDGFINASNQSATVKLSTSIPLNASVLPDGISDAQVSIESSDGVTFGLQNLGNGTYEASSIAWNMDTQYRLSISVNSGENYQSDFITLTRSPDIDSVTFREGKDALNFYVNTHGAPGGARYYKWDYEETWEYTSSFVSFYKIVNGEAYERSVDERIYMCWSASPSTTILVYNTWRLSDDVVSDFFLTAVPAGSVQLSRRYSLNVLQRTLSEEEYEFWSQLRKTTEEVGGLFDPQPYAITGNIQGTNNNNIVLGYFGGGEVKERRIFVGLNELPVNIARQTMRMPCPPEEIQSLSVSDLQSVSPTITLLLDPIYVQGVGVVGYTFSYPDCADCRTQGGTTAKPDFW